MGRTGTRRRTRDQTLGKAAVLALALLLLASLGWLWASRRPGPTVEIRYGPEDIATDQPLRAVHEMNVSGPPIPFLPPDGPQPRLALSQSFHDFGSVGPTDVVTHDFVLANLGEAPLTISRAYTTCGCTTADLSSAVIPPGKVAILTVRFDAGFHDVRRQTVRRGVILENNDPEHSVAEVWIQASVRANP